MDYNISTFSDYQLVQKKAECDVGTKIRQGRLTISQCAAACRGTSQMFVHGTNEFGGDSCVGEKCSCYCEIGSENYQCNNIKINKGLNLYNFFGKCSFIHCCWKCYVALFT